MNSPLYRIFLHECRVTSICSETAASSPSKSLVSTPVGGDAPHHQKSDRLTQSIGGACTKQSLPFPTSQMSDFLQGTDSVYSRYQRFQTHFSIISCYVPPNSLYQA